MIPALASLMLRIAVLVVLATVLVWVSPRVDGDHLATPHDQPGAEAGVVRAQEWSRVVEKTVVALVKAAIS
jgi:hypothetical protein